MRRNTAVTGVRHVIGVGVLLWCSLATPAGAAPADPAALAKECEYGVVLALEGRTVAAESVFVSLLTHAPGDPRAFTNLGNLNLLRGKLDLALAFYARAAAVDSTDPGIRLNEATALMLRGDEDLAQDRAREAIALAGGARNAARLLGLSNAGIEEEAPKAAERAYVTRDEVAALLKAAVKHVPADSTRADTTKAGATDLKTQKRVPPTWRSAGARAAEGTEAAAVVYWKR